MDSIRGLLIGILNLVLVLVLVIGTLGGFFGFGFSSPFGGFSFGKAILGGILGFLGSAVWAAFLALMLDIREILLRIEQRGAR